MVDTTKKLEIYSKSKTYLTSKQVENQIETLKTSRSCPTGYSERELRACSNEELLNLRNLTFEYLKNRSSKTRNVQFIHLIKRINAELNLRNIDTHISLQEMDYTKTSKLFNTDFCGEYTLNNKQPKIDKNYDFADIASSLNDNINSVETSTTYNTNKALSSNININNINNKNQGKSSLRKKRDRNYVINTKYFTIRSANQLEIPSFLHDLENTKPNKPIHFLDFKSLSNDTIFENNNKDRSTDLSSSLESKPSKKDSLGSFGLIKDFEDEYEINLNHLTQYPNYAEKKDCIKELFNNFISNPSNFDLQEDHNEFLKYVVIAKEESLQ